MLNRERTHAADANSDICATLQSRGISHGGSRHTSVWERELDEFGRAYVRALLSGDEIGAEIAIREAMDAKLPAAEIDDKIIAPALWRVGELWERGEISVADEHIATEISLRVLALQREAERTAQARGGHVLMLAAPAGELHIVALRMADNLLRSAGYGIVMLGADVPAEGLRDAAQRYRPDVVCFTVTLPRSARNVLGAIDAVREQCPTAGFVIGAHRGTCPAEAYAGIELCRRVSEVVEAVDATIKHAALN